jgi:dTDP-4-dehydrorhamnose reductase
MGQAKVQKVLLTGFTGQVGSDLLLSVPPGYEVVCAKRPGEEFLDLTDFAALRAFVADVKPDIILNPAAYTAVDKAESEPDLAHAINAEAPRVLAEEAKKLGALLVHYSTDYVFNGDPAHGPWKESDPTGPLNAYGRTKLAGEIAIRESGCRHLIFRTSWVYGRHGHNFLKTILRLAAEREELKIVSDQIGAPTTSDFLARMTWKALEVMQTPDGAKLEGLYHLTCSSHCSWHVFATEIVRLHRERGMQLKVQRILPIPTVEYKTPAQRPLNSRLDCGKFEGAFHREKLQVWKDALMKVVTV